MASAEPGFREAFEGGGELSEIESEPKEEGVSDKDDGEEDENEDDLLTMKRWKAFLGNLAIRYHQEIIGESFKEEK